MTIKAVIFDFGGVILDLNYHATTDAMRQLLGHDSDLIYSQVKQSSLFDELETGEITPDSFYKKLAEATGRPLDPLAVDKAWNAMLLGTRMERLDFLKRVAKHRRIFLLSNTNAIHKAAFDQTLKQTLKEESFDDLFEAAYYSHLIGLRKPESAIFHYVLNQHGLKAEETLFIDDSLANIEGAQRAGLQVWHLQGELLDAPLQYLEQQA